MLRQNGVRGPGYERVRVCHAKMPKTRRGRRRPLLLASFVRMIVGARVAGPESRARRERMRAAQELSLGSGRKESPGHLAVRPESSRRRRRPGPCHRRTYFFHCEGAVDLEPARRPLSPPRARPAWLSRVPNEFRPATGQQGGGLCRTIHSISVVPTWDPRKRRRRW
jgi:hypothetical protein